MDLNKSALDFELAIPVCDALMQYKQNRASQQRLIQLEAFLGASVRKVDVPQLSLLPAYFFAAAPGVLFIGILGATTLPQVANIQGSWLRPASSRGNTGIDRFAFASAQTMNVARVEVGATGFRRIIIGGYSWGGAIASALAFLLQTDEPNAVVSVVTFGSPKVGTLNVPFSLRAIDIGRWMNDGDFIPFAPPTQQQAPNMYSLLLFDDRVQVSQYCHPFNGMVLDPQRHAYEAYLPPTDSVFTDLSIGNFLINNDSPVAQAHAIEAYYLKLIGLVPDVPPVRVPPAQTNILDQREIAVRRTHTGNPMDAPRNVPVPSDSSRPSVLPAGTLNPYYAAKENGQHVVKYAELTIAIAKGGKSARGLAASLNTAWRRWNRTRRGDGPLLSSTVEQLFLS